MNLLLKSLGSLLNFEDKIILKNIIQKEDKIL